MLLWPWVPPPPPPSPPPAFHLLVSNSSRSCRPEDVKNTQRTNILMWMWVIGVSKSTSADVGISRPPPSSASGPPTLTVSHGLQSGRPSWETCGRAGLDVPTDLLARCWIAAEGRYCFWAARLTELTARFLFFIVVPPFPPIPPSPYPQVITYVPETLGPATAAGLSRDQLTWCCSYVRISCKISTFAGRESRDCATVGTLNGIV